ncbi:hypothetical protein [Helicobacter canis]|nr:hypothetical protein [Helicobacter canis]
MKSAWQSVASLVIHNQKVDSSFYNSYQTPRIHFLKIDCHDFLMEISQ